MLCPRQGLQLSVVGSTGTGPVETLALGHPFVASSRTPTDAGSVESITGAPPISECTWESLAAMHRLESTFACHYNDFRARKTRFPGSRSPGLTIPSVRGIPAVTLNSDPDPTLLAALR